jgi:hypothetical protein
MKVNDFEYETDVLSSYKLEEQICYACGDSAPHSSNLNWHLEVEDYKAVTLLTEKHSISCYVSICKGLDKKYCIQVRNINKTKLRY